MTDIRFKTLNMITRVRDVVNRATKDSMPKTLDEAAERNYSVEDFRLGLETVRAFEELANEYASTVEKMSKQLDDIEHQLLIMNAKLMTEEK